MVDGDGNGGTATQKHGKTRMVPVVGVAGAAGAVEAGWVGVSGAGCHCYCLAGGRDTPAAQWRR